VVDRSYPRTYPLSMTPISPNRLYPGTGTIARQLRNNEPESPCVNVCKLAGGQCTGCYRTKEEIARWRTASQAERWQILLRVAQRRIIR